MVDEEELRRDTRRRAILEAKIFDQHGSTGTCVVNDLSRAGARIRTDFALEVGAEVYLKINRFTDLRRAEVMWVRENRAGLQFVRRIERPPEAMTEFFKRMPTE